VTISATSGVDVVALISTILFVVVIFGLVALALWLRDRSRDLKGVPAWVRQRGQLKAARLGTGYAILAHVASAAAFVVAAFHATSLVLVCILMAIASISLLSGRGSLRDYRKLSQQIEKLTKENHSDLTRPYEPLG